MLSQVPCSHDRGGGTNVPLDRTCVCGAPVASAADVSNLRRILLARHAGWVSGIALPAIAHRHDDDIMHAGSCEVCTLPPVCAIPAIMSDDM